MIKQTVYSITLLFFLGCYLSRFDLIKEPNRSVTEIPGEVVEYFNSQKKPKLEPRKIWESDESRSIINGVHEDIYVQREGVIASKKYGWRCNVKYSPFIEFENERYIVVDVGYEGTTFRPMRGWWLVIRKNDGKILRSYDSFSVNTNMEYNGILYFQTTDYGPEYPSKVFCIRLGE